MTFQIREDKEGFLFLFLSEIKEEIKEFLLFLFSEIKSMDYV